MTRKTSSIAYKRIIEEGLLSKLRLLVYRVVYKYGPLTASEVRMYVAKHSTANSGVFSTRFSELKKMGVLETVGERPCTTSGHIALLWDVTENLPKPIKKEKTKKEKKKEAIKDLKKIYKDSPEELKKDILSLYKKIKNI
jgi:hypothetical protein